MRNAIFKQRCRWWVGGFIDGSRVSQKCLSLFLILKNVTKNFVHLLNTCLKIVIGFLMVLKLGLKFGQGGHAFRQCPNSKTFTLFVFKVRDMP